MYGGEGNDTFIFRDITDSGIGAGQRDRIMDWAAGDKIDLSFIDADGNTNNGNQAFEFIGGDGFTGAGQVRYVQDGNGHTIIQVNADSDPKSVEFEIELNNGNFTLTENDFQL